MTPAQMNHAITQDTRLINKAETDKALFHAENKNTFEIASRFEAIATNKKLAAKWQVSLRD